MLIRFRDIGRIEQEHTSSVPRNLHHAFPLHIPPLYRLRKLIQHFKRWHRDASFLPLTQRLAQQVFELDEIALCDISLRCTL
jgi:hypothetical protein